MAPTDAKGSRPGIDSAGTGSCSDKLIEIPRNSRRDVVSVYQAIESKGREKKRTLRGGDVYRHRLIY